MARPRTDAREQLLARVVEHLADHGVAGLSLRELAGDLGTSHRMLVYHFGSKAGLLAEVVRHVEAAQRAPFEALAAAVAAGADGAIPGLAVTDTIKSLSVSYKGQLPDLFREGQGVVAEGVLQGDGTMLADTVLAKHDEKYMPKDVADKLKEKGVWQEGQGGAQPATQSGAQGTSP